MKLQTTPTQLSTTNASRAGGFTVIELLVATSVFSLVLLVSLVGFLQIGQIFYKGVAVTQTSQDARALMDAIKADITYSSAQDGMAISAGPSGAYKYFCTGANRYTFKQGAKVDTSNHNFATKFGLVKDTLPTADGCAPPTGRGSVPFSNPTELLGNRMRLSNITVAKLPSPNDRLYNLTIKVVYGDNEVLNNATSTNPTCQSNTSSSRYCYVYELNTIVGSGF